MWLAAAVLSAFFAGITTILAKCGIKNTDSDITTALRTVVVFIFSWCIVLIFGSASTIFQISTKSFIFLILSGIATGASWLCYFKALSIGNVNKVASVDKSSTIISVILAIIIFNETNNIEIKSIGIVLLCAGIFLMANQKQTSCGKQYKSWFIYAALSAVFASITSVLAKIGIENVDSNLGTSIRTSVVLIMSWIIVFGKHKQSQLKSINSKDFIFIVLSGIATGASWLCYYYAIQNGILSIVIPIDKMSIVFTIAFSYIVLKEKISKKAFLGLILMIAGTLLIAIFG